MSKRREFLKTTGISLIGASVLPLQSCAWSEAPGEIPWEIHSDGSFDLISENLKLKGCFPSIDGSPLRPHKVSLHLIGNLQTIEYWIEKGKVSITLGMHPERLSLSTVLKGDFSETDWFYPLAGAQIEGADRFYKHGFGFAGASGVFQIPDSSPKLEMAKLKEETWSYDSYLATALIAENNKSLVWGSFQHSQFLQRSTLYNRQHRFGLIDRHLDEERIYAESGFALERTLSKDAKTILPKIYFFRGNKPYNTLQDFATELAKAQAVALPHPPRYYWCSWYEKAMHFSQSDLDAFIMGIKKTPDAPSIQAIQIDAGYSILGDWLISNQKWPLGLHAAQEIQKAGYQAGIWVGPFMVNSNSTVFRNHPEWLLHDSSGNLIVEMEEDYHSGGRVCVLDTSHPDAFEYLRTVFRTLKAWGFTLFKTDFLDWGYRDSLKVRRYAPGKTSAQYFSEVAMMIREELGPECYWLGCIAPFQPLVGLADAVRISNDVGSSFNDESAGNMFRQITAESWTNHILWQNDPDVIYLKSFPVDYSENQLQSMILAVGILGGVVNTSDRFDAAPGYMLQWFRFLKPGLRKNKAVLPLWGKPGAPLVASIHYDNRQTWAVAFVNHSDQTTRVSIPIKEINGLESSFVFTWNPGKNEPLGQMSEINLRLEPWESVLFYINPSNLPPPKNMLLSGEIDRETF